MDELRGPTIQIVLHVKEGLGFGFLRVPFIVSGSLNGYLLETDPAIPCHAPVFDAELVWEADKRRFRNLRVQNVPVKIEVFTTGTQGRKDKIGYLLLSLLAAQPCPANKVVDVKYTWHRLLGVKSEGKCCHPQIMMSLSIEDRTTTLTPRNELRMFHSNEVAYLTKQTSHPNAPTTGRSVLMTVNEYMIESKRSVTSLDLQPKLNCEEGLIQIGSGKQQFVLSFVIGSAENVEMILPDQDPPNKDTNDCYIAYSVFTHNIMTDRVTPTVESSRSTAHFNQRTSLRLRTDLSDLGRYFAQCPHVVIRLCSSERDVGICSMDLRKLVPTQNITHFVENFCNADQALTIHERCFILGCDEKQKTGDRRPFVDVEMSLKYVVTRPEATQRPSLLTARSVTQLESGRNLPEQQALTLDYRSGSCTHLGDDGDGVAYTSITASNTNRYRNAAGDAALQTSEIADLIKKMCESFTLSQEKLLASKLRPTTSDMQVQCETDLEDIHIELQNRNSDCEIRNIDKETGTKSEAIKLEASKSDSCIETQMKCDRELQNEKDMVRKLIPPADRDAIMQRFVDELEDWKEKQQELYKCQLKRKEEYHLELLSKEWTKKRSELELKLAKGIEQCRNLAADLSRATEDFRLRGYRNTERERKLLEAKQGLEQHYTAKYHALQEASQRMEEDMQRLLAAKDARIQELETSVQQLQRQVEVEKNNLKNAEKDADTKYSGLTKDQTTSLIQELRCLEEKLDSAVQGKAFFKQQWGRCVTELHLLKLNNRRQMLDTLHSQRRELAGDRLDTIQDQEEVLINSNPEKVDINRLKDDFYVDILANTPVLDSHSISATSGPDGMDMFNELKMMPKNPVKERLAELIDQREQLIGRDSPDEEQLAQLNQEIRTMLLNCGT